MNGPVGRGRDSDARMAKSALHAECNVQNKNRGRNEDRENHCAHANDNERETGRVASKKLKRTVDANAARMVKFGEQSVRVIDHGISVRDAC